MHRMSTVPLQAISSMATRAVLADAARLCEAQGGPPVEIESVGGVDAARRVQAGEAFDLVLLAEDALAKLAGAGLVQAASITPFVRSAVAVAVRAGDALPDLASTAGLRAALEAAQRIGYSTGPSGTALLKLIDAWGLSAALQGRLVQAPAGVPVAQLVARGEVALGFQQRAELLGQPGITLVGDLPADAAIVTTFSGAVGSMAGQPEAARDWLGFLAGTQTQELKRHHGMAPA
jgi:molybdate transport system substrate-binding protein